MEDEEAEDSPMNGLQRLPQNPTYTQICKMSQGWGTIAREDHNNYCPNKSFVNLTTIGLIVTGKWNLAN